jgi:hypothetical protein
MAIRRDGDPASSLEARFDRGSIPALVGQIHWSLAVTDASVSASLCAYPRVLASKCRQLLQIYSEHPLHAGLLSVTTSARQKMRGCGDKSVLAKREIAFMFAFQ